MSNQSIESSGILCFGDSLTSGYCRQGRKSYPYAIKLSKLLSKHNENNDVQYNVDVAGVPGEGTKDMLQRFQTDCVPNLNEFKLICILGGTNDLGNPSESGPTVVARLLQMHSTCHKQGVKTIAIGIPPHGQERQFPAVAKKRRYINDALQRISQSLNTVFYFDLENAIPMFDIDHSERIKCWDDLLHYTVYGYNKFGESLYKFIIDNQVLFAQITN